jgi:hypothetical protein
MSDNFGICSTNAAPHLFLRGKVAIRYKKGLSRRQLETVIISMNSEVRHAELEEDHHTRLRYLSWSEKIHDKWVRQTVVLRADETHPILEERKSVAEHSRLT